MNLIEGKTIAQYLPHSDVFYNESVVKRHVTTSATGSFDVAAYVMYPPLFSHLTQYRNSPTKQTYAEALKIVKVDQPEIHRHYWEVHNPRYLRRLDRLLERSQLPGAVSTSTKAVIAIPAMNEVKLTRTINAIEESYGQDIDPDLLLVLYHNFKETPDKDVLESVQQARQHPGVKVVEERVPFYNNTPMAKKVVSDLVMRTMEHSRRVPIIMMDADVCKLTPNLIQQAWEQLKRPKVLAASPEYDFDEEVAERFPIAGLVWGLEKYIRRGNQLFINLKMAIGSFTAIHPSVLAAVGGYIPMGFEDLKIPRAESPWVFYLGFML